LSLSNAAARVTRLYDAWSKKDKVNSFNRDDGVDDRVPNGMRQALERTQLEHGTIDISDGELLRRKDLFQLFDRGVLDLRREMELSGEALQFHDQHAVFFHARLALQHAFFDIRAICREDHPQAGQGAGVILLLAVEWKLDTHSTSAPVQDRPRSASPVPYEPQEESET
jgi:hypothetical protein